MEILINDLSLSGQFETVDDFADELTNNILPILKKGRELGFLLLKKTTIYNSKVTFDKTLNSLLIIQLPEITLLKKYIADMIDNPYWDESIISDDTAMYDLGFDCKTPNCITETFERNGMLLSFKDVRFENKYIHILKNGLSKKIKNCINYSMFAEHMIDIKEITLVEFLLSFTYERKLDFYKKSKIYYIDEPYLDNEFNQDDIQTIKNDLMSLIRSINNNERSRHKEEFPYRNKKYFAFRTSISDNREFRMYYIEEDETLVFLYPFIKKSASIPDRILENVEKLSKEYRDSCKNT